MNQKPQRNQRLSCCVTEEEKQQFTNISFSKGKTPTWVLGEFVREVIKDPDIITVKSGVEFKKGE